MTAPNTPTPELEPKPVELVTRLKARTVKLFKGLFSEDIPDPDCFEAAAAIANLTAERDKWRDTWMKSAHDEAEAIRERDEAIERAEAAENRAKELEVSLTIALNDVVLHDMVAQGERSTNKLLAERVAVLEGIIADNWQGRYWHGVNDAMQDRVNDAMSLRRALAAREEK